MIQQHAEVQGFTQLGQSHRDLAFQEGHSHLQFLWCCSWRAAAAVSSTALRAHAQMASAAPRARSALVLRPPSRPLLAHCGAPQTAWTAMMCAAPHGDPTMAAAMHARGCGQVPALVYFDCCRIGLTKSQAIEHLHGLLAANRGLAKLLRSLGTSECTFQCEVSMQNLCVGLRSPDALLPRGFEQALHLKV